MGVKFLHGAEDFHQGEVLFFQTAYNFHAAKIHFMQLWLELFLGICTKISKKCQYHEDFLTKFLNINNHTPYFLNRVVILQEAKNYSQHEEIFAAWRKNYCLQGR